MMNKEEARKKAQAIKAEEREQEIANYLNKATSNQKKAAEQLKGTIEEANDSFKEAINKAQPQDKAKLIQLVQNVNSLLLKARKGGDIEQIVSELKKLKK